MFVTEPYVEDNIISYWDNIEFTSLSDEPAGMAVEAFAVRDDGVIALCHKTANGSGKTVWISVYSNDGVFERGYYFYISKGSVDVVWSGENISVIIGEDHMLTFAPSGAIVDRCELPFCQENRQILKQIQSKTKNVGGDSYVLSAGDSFLDNVYPVDCKLICHKNNGEDVVIYDSYDAVKEWAHEAAVSMLVMPVVWLIVAVVVVFKVVIPAIKRTRDAQ